MTRVGVIGPMDADSFADNIVDSLPDLGVEVSALGTTKPDWRWSRARRAATRMIVTAAPDWEARRQKALVGGALDAGCDVVISTQDDLLPQTVQALRDGGVEVALWFPDHVGNIGRAMMYMAPYSRVYFKDRLVAERAATVQGIGARYLPEAFNPRWHRPVGGQPGDDSGLVLAGTMYPTRAILLERLVGDGIPLKLYGGTVPPWLAQRETILTMHTGRRVLREEKARIFRRAQAVLNNLHPAELESVNCRLFEATGSGAVVITEMRPALLDLFEPDVEVLTFATYDELLNQWKRVADDPGLGLRVGDAAAARALAEHTYQHRLRVVLEDLVR